jgi:hypothetical protein
MTEVLDTIAATAPPIGFQDILSPPVEQVAQQNYLARALTAGRETVGSMVEFAQVGAQTAGSTIDEAASFIHDKAVNAGHALRRNAVRVGTIGLTAFSTVGGVGLAVSSASAKVTPTVRAAAASGSREPQCAGAGYVPDTVSPSYVDQAVLPLASKVIDVYRHTKPSERRQLKTNEITDLSYHHVTEISARLPARPAHGRVKGTYDYVADFEGSVTPSNLVAVWVEYDRNNPAHGPSMYQFELAKTTTNGPSNEVGIHWLMSLNYGPKQKGYYFMQSQLPDGGEVTTSYSMTAPILSANTRQAIGVLGRAEKHQPIRGLKDLATSQKLVEVCP